MPKSHFEGRKTPMYIVEFTLVNGRKKRVEFFSPQKAGSFYDTLKGSENIRRVKKKKVLLTGQERREVNKNLKNK